MLTLVEWIFRGGLQDKSSHSEKRLIRLLEGHYDKLVCSLK